MSEYLSHFRTRFHHESRSSKADHASKLTATVSCSHVLHAVDLPKPRVTHNRFTHVFPHRDVNHQHTIAELDTNWIWMTVEFGLQTNSIRKLLNLDLSTFKKPETWSLGAHFIAFLLPYVQKTLEVG